MRHSRVRWHRKPVRNQDMPISGAAPDRSRPRVQPSAVLVTGASSGIGRALAIACAGPGVTLHLGGRDADRLAKTQNDCAARGAAVVTGAVDVVDRAAMQDWVEQAGTLDLVLACAGISGGPRPAVPGCAAQEDASQIRRILSVNLDGVLNTVLPAVSVMQRQPRTADGRRGRIAAIASVAGLVSSPASPTYCASKAAVDRWLIATGANLAPEGILLSSVVCGFVRSAMTARNEFAMPGLMDADRAAGLILRGLDAGRRRIVFPWWMAAGARLADLLPMRLTEAVLARQPAKAADPD